MKYYVSGWRNIINYKGRTSRKEFWMFFVWDLIVSAILFGFMLFCFYILGFEELAGIISVLYVTYLMIAIAPALAIWMRRLHDIGRSGWFYFLVLIPLVGPIVLLYFASQNSKHGENKYGLNPKGIGNDGLEIAS